MVGMPPQGPNRDYPNGFHDPNYHGSLPPQPQYIIVPVDAKKKNSWVMRGIAVVGVTAVVVLGINAASTYFQYERAGEAWEKLQKNDKSVSASGTPAHEGSSNTGAPDMFNKDITREDYGRQLDVTLPYLQERRAQSLKEASDELELQNRANPLLPSNMPADETLRAAQIDQNNITADLWTVSKETNSILARNLLNAIFFNDLGNSNDAYDVSVRNIGSGKRILEPTTVVEASPTFTGDELGGFKIEGQPSYVAQLVSRTEDAAAYEEVISLRNSQNGKSSGNVVMRNMRPNELYYVERPSQMHPAK